MVKLLDCSHFGKFLSGSDFGIVRPVCSLIASVRYLVAKPYNFSDIPFALVRLEGENFSLQDA
jgi:hypothetical protein